MPSVTVACLHEWRVEQSTSRWLIYLQPIPFHNFFGFVHRRGPVWEMYGDRGTNFLLAERELREGDRRWNQSLIHESLRQKGVEWHFNLPLSASSGGAWEILSQIGQEDFTFPCQRTNSRWWSCPLVIGRNWKYFEQSTTYPSQGQHTRLIGAVLTPAMFPTGTLDSSLPADVFIEADGYRRSWRLVQLHDDCFRKRRVKEYLLLLQHRQKWLKPSRKLQKQTLNVPIGPRHWCRTHRNNIVRKVRVRTASFSFLHDVRKLLFRDHWSMSCPVYLFSLLAFVQCLTCYVSSESYLLTDNATECLSAFVHTCGCALLVVSHVIYLI